MGYQTTCSVVEKMMLDEIRDDGRFLIRFLTKYYFTVSKRLS